MNLFYRKKQKAQKVVESYKSKISDVDQEVKSQIIEPKKFVKIYVLKTFFKFI